MVVRGGLDVSERLNVYDAAVDANSSLGWRASLVARLRRRRLQYSLQPGNLTSGTMDCI